MMQVALIYYSRYSDWFDPNKNWCFLRKRCIIVINKEK